MLFLLAMPFLFTISYHKNIYVYFQEIFYDIFNFFIFHIFLVEYQPELGRSFIVNLFNHQPIPARATAQNSFGRFLFVTPLTKM